jgi:hypothetical protein
LEILCQSLLNQDFVSQIKVHNDSKKSWNQAGGTGLQKLGSARILYGEIAADTLLENQVILR